MIQHRDGETYGKFTNLGIVDAHDLIFLGCAQAETGNEVHNQKNNAASNERIRESRHGVSQLISELDIVVVDPASWNHCGPVEASDVVAVFQCQPSIPCAVGEGQPRDTYAANKPVRRLPTRPPIAWTAKISSASSTPKRCLILVA